MDENTPCATQFKRNQFGKYVPVCCSFKPKQQEKIWEELNWEQKTKGDKIRTLVAYDDEIVKNEIVDILAKRKDVEIIAISRNPEDTYEKIVELKPEMVFTKYDFGLNMKGIDIIKKSKQTLNNEVPVFNIIAPEIPKEEYLEVKSTIGDKMNTIIREQTEGRYNGIIEDYKESQNRKL